MKIYNGTPGYGRPLSEEEINEFLGTTTRNLQLATIDKLGEPNIHPVWFLFENGLLYVATEKLSRKVKNILSNNLVYFSIDEDNSGFKGVRGKGDARILEDKKLNENIAKKIVLKYAQNLDGKLAREVLDEIKIGVEVILEITPRFYSSWEFTL